MTHPEERTLLKRLNPAVKAILFPALLLLSMVWAAVAPGVLGGLAVTLFMLGLAFARITPRYRDASFMLVGAFVLLSVPLRLGTDFYLLGALAASLVAYHQEIKLSKRLVKSGIALGLAAIAIVLVAVVPGLWAKLFVCGVLVAAVLFELALPDKLVVFGLVAIASTMGLYDVVHQKGGDVYLLILAGILIFTTQDTRIPRWGKALFSLAILLVAFPIAALHNTSLLDLGIKTGIYAAMALGLNVVVGMAGLLDLGYAAFFAIGAYTWAIFGSPQAAQFMAGNFPLPGAMMYLFMFVAIATTALTGILIGLPALRLRGDYLAIVTLGLGEVVRVLANNLNQPVNITNGPQGITPVGKPPIDWFIGIFNFFNIHLDKATDYQLFFYFLVLVVIAIIIFVKSRLSKSRFGRAWIAIREDEIAAKAMGIPMVKTKLLAFATGAGFSGAMGVIYAANQSFVSPEPFTLLASIMILGMVVLGGMGSIQGVLLGAAVLTILNLDMLKGLSETLNAAKQSETVVFGFNLANLPNELDPAKYERLVFGVVLILMMIFRPEGLIPEKRHRDELDEPAANEVEAVDVEGGKK